jgi:glycerol-3-phosphate dehydrogenase
MKNIAIIGSGSWGVALSLYLATAFPIVSLYSKICL